MTIIEKIICLFTKKQKKQEVFENTYLDKWEKLKKFPETYIGDIFLNTKNLNEIAIALVYTDERIKERFFIMADAYNKEKLLKDLIIENSSVLKNKSDKMKAHITNLFLLYFLSSSRSLIVFSIHSKQFCAISTLSLYLSFVISSYSPGYLVMRAYFVKFVASFIFSGIIINFSSPSSNILILCVNSGSTP